MTYETINDAVTMKGGGQANSERHADAERDIEHTINDALTMQDGGVGSLGRIDQYELVRELGGGGFGTVYLAHDTIAGIDVAVKGLPPMIRNNSEELERIRENFALISRLHHPYIAAALVLHPAKEVTYNDPSVRQKLRVDSGDTLMVMEYAPGVTLSRWRKQFPDGKVPLEPAIQIVWQIAQALDFAHEQHIIHRDIKPSNIMVETKPGGEVTARLLDFGLAAELRSSMGRVSNEIHDTSGTRPYMAPEQWVGRKQGPATDQYALAVLLCELLTGEVPFSSAFETGDPMVMMNAVCNHEVELPISCPRRGVLLKALAKEPSRRFTSCMEFIETAAKSDSAHTEGIEASKWGFRGSTEKQRRRCGVRAAPVMAALGISAIAIGLVVIGGVLWYSHSQRQRAQGIRYDCGTSENANEEKIGKSTEFVESTSVLATQATASNIKYKYNYSIDKQGYIHLWGKSDHEPCISPKPEGTFTLPTVIDGHKVIQLGWHAFAGCDKLTTFIFPKDVVQGFWIDPYIFRNCPKLRRVVFQGDAPGLHVPPNTNSKGRNIFSFSAPDIVVEVKKGTKGWKNKNTTELPSRWPTRGYDSRPIRCMQ